jgi:hypothetical protein
MRGSRGKQEVSGPLARCCEKTPEKPYFWLMVSEVSGHSQLVPLLWACEAENHGVGVCAEELLTSW